MKKIYLLSSLILCSSIMFGQIIFNEVLYDPSNSGLLGDANRDGIYSQDDDSFVEIYNSSTNAFDISGYEIWDDTTTGGGTVQYTFPPNTSIPPQEVIVVFGGGTITGGFGTGIILNATTGFNFNNSGEVIGVKDNNGAWVLFFDSDALSNNPNESYTRAPDVTGGFVQHGDTTSVLFSPGTRVDGSAFNLGLNLTENSATLDLNIYPNPAANYIQIETEKTIDLVEIYSLSGQLVQTLKPNNNKLNIENLEIGSYLLKIVADDQISSARFIKQ